MRGEKKYLAATTAPNTGKLLTNFFDEKRIHKSALARAINRLPKTVYSYEKNSSIQTSILWEMCHALKHNFFDDIATMLPDTFTTNRPVATTFARIAELEQEIEILNREKLLLLEAMKR